MPTELATADELVAELGRNAEANQDTHGMTPWEKDADPHNVGCSDTRQAQSWRTVYSDSGDQRDPDRKRAVRRGGLLPTGTGGASRAAHPAQDRRRRLRQQPAV